MILIKFFILGILTALLFPPFFMLPLGFILFPYLIKLLNDISSRLTFKLYFICGFNYGLGFLIVFLSWIYNPFLVNEETKNFAFLAMLLPFFLSLFFGLIFLLYKYIRGFFTIIILTPFIFLLIELIISNIFYGFPWISYSLILSNNFIGFYILKFYGIYVSSYLILFAYVMPLIFIYFNKLKNKIKFLIILNLPFLFGVIFLSFSLNLKDKKNFKELSIEVFQILTPLDNINRDLIEKNIITNIKNSNSELIIFAENNYPFLITDINNTNLMQYIENNKKVIIGLTRKDNNKFYNSFLFLEKNNIQHFDKKILVPFGEFLPLRKYLKFMENISGDVDFTSGEKDRLISTSNNFNILPIICYEIIFNKILKNINKNEIDLLVNITNDSWFGNKIGPFQHFYHTRMRSLISNKSLVRVSNNGISAIIDSSGKIIKFSKLNDKTSFKYVLKIYDTTYYNLLHIFFLIYLILIFFIYCFFNISKSNYVK